MPQFEQKHIIHIAFQFIIIIHPELQSFKLQVS